MLSAINSRRYPFNICLVSVFRVEGGELFDRIIDESFDLTERVAILFMRQIIDGIMYIHSQNILHLDMKVNSIFAYILIIDLFGFRVSKLGRLYGLVRVVTPPNPELDPSKRG